MWAVRINTEAVSLHTDERCSLSSTTLMVRGISITQPVAAPIWTCSVHTSSKVGQKISYVRRESC
jgi:hypothetical protein